MRVTWGKGGPEGKKAQARLLGVLGVTMAMGGVSLRCRLALWVWRRAGSVQ